MKLGMYKVTDDYGTKQWAWTKADALDWLLYCGPRAEVHNIWGRLVAARTQEELKHTTAKEKEMPRVTNREAREYVKQRKDFTGSNLFARWTRVPVKQEREVREVYIVYSYDKHWPLFLYDPSVSIWFENTDKYSRTTSRHKTQVHPHVDTVKCDLETIQSAIYNGVGAVIMRGEAQ